MNILILYHARCPDGFGGAYAAWKKFGNNARYVAVEHRTHIPDDVAGATVFCIDHCFPADVTTQLVARAESVMVLDHHSTNREVIAAYPGWQYSDTHSGSVMAWQYFHPNTPLPLLFKYVEEDDLWNFTLPNSKTIRRWVNIQPMTFKRWDAMVTAFEDPAQLAEITRTAQAYEEYFNHFVEEYAQKAERVLFEGIETLAVQAPSFLRHDVGHRLTTLKGPLGIVWRLEGAGIRCSLRGDGTIDVAALAERHGGGGHHNAAAFLIPHTLPLPFTLVHD